MERTTSTPPRRCFAALVTLRARLGGEGGYILIQVALMFTILMGIVGAGVDYGALVVENTRIQAAIDAASLAGARSLVSGNNPGTAAADATITSYLANYGYQSDARTTITKAYSASLPGGLVDTATVTVTRQQGMFFWRAIGINQVTISKSATASANGAMVDVMLSLDTTGSMEMSGTNDLAQLRQAVADFVNQMNPSSTDPFGPKVGMARFAGVGCSWARGSGNDTGNGRTGTNAWIPDVNNQRGDGDVYMDLNNASGSGTASWSEYVTPCYDDLQVLSNLTYNKASLLQLAQGPSSGCPALPFTNPGMSSSSAAYACPLTTFDFIAPQVYGTPTTIQGLQYGNSTQSSGPQPILTGTRLANAITVVKNSGTGYYAWDTANGGRNDAFTGNYARKVLVMITDGFNETYPTLGIPYSNATWDSDVVNAANALKRGADNTLGTPDDVEIYVVGFFCTPYSTSTSVPQKWCASTMADTTPPHPCPNNVWNAGAASAIDTLLRNVSSSNTGTCDHYFPIKKTESLPQLFRTLAGSVARGKLSG